MAGIPKSAGAANTLGLKNLVHWGKCTTVSSPAKGVRIFSNLCLQLWAVRAGAGARHVQAMHPDLGVLQLRRERPKAADIIDRRAGLGQAARTGYRDLGRTAVHMTGIANNDYAHVGAN